MAHTISIPSKSRASRPWFGNFFWTAIIAVQVYWLTYDLWDQNRSELGNSDSKVVIATLIGSHRSVHLQNKGELIWTPAKNGQKLADGQSLMTLEESQAEIYFNEDQSRILLGENSLLEITPIQKRLDESDLVLLKLKRGSFQLKREHTDHGPELNLSLGDHTMELSANSEIRVQAMREGMDKENVIQVQVLSGQAAVLPVQGDKVQVLQGEAFEIQLNSNLDQGKNLKKISLNWTVLNPIPQSRIRAQYNKQLKFILHLGSNHSAEADPVTVQISPDPQFKTLAWEGRLHLKDDSWQTDVEHTQLIREETQRYYWRLFPLRHQTEGYFIMDPPYTVQALLPFEKASLPSDQNIHFVWEKLPLVGHYQLHLIKKEKGENSIQNFELKDAQHIVTPLPVGDYQWSVRAQLSDEGSYTPWSRTREVRVYEASPPPPGTFFGDQFEFIQLKTFQTQDKVQKQKSKINEGQRKKPLLFSPQSSLSPKDFSSFTLSLSQWISLLLPDESKAEDQLGVLHDRNVTAENSWQVRIRWEEVAGVKRYRLQISSHDHFKKLEVDEIIDGVEYYWHYRLGMENQQGKVFYRVGSLSEDGRMGSFSAAQPIPIPKEILAQSAKVQKKPTDNLVKIKSEPEAVKVSTEEKTLEASPVLEKKLSVSYGFGIGNLQQSSSSSDLDEVSIENFPLEQRLDLDYQFKLFERNALARLSLQSERFGSSQETRPAPLQPEQRTWMMAADLLFTSIIPTASESQWRLYYGLSLDWSYRFIKSGLQSVEARSALSLGPSVAYVVDRETYQTSWTRAGLNLRLPLTGFLLTGRYGAELQLWSEWDLYRFSQRSRLGIRMVAEGGYARWKEPITSTLLSWSVFLAPVFYWK